MDKLVDVLIVNYRTKELTADAIRSALAEDVVHEVIVVENHSEDDSAQWLTKMFAGKPVRVLDLPENVGFGGGNNAAAQVATAPYLFLLNSDAYCKQGCVDILLKALQDPAVGVAAPMVYLDDEKTLQRDAQGAFPTWSSLLLKSTSFQENSFEPDWVSGVSFMVRREEYQKIGGFNAQLFMYFEDVELCRQYRLREQRVVRVPEAAVVHLGGRSKQSTKRQKAMYYRSQDSYLALSGAPALGRVLVSIARAGYILVGNTFLWH